MNNRRVCIVSTQMQLLNCVELLYDLQQSNNELLIIAQTNSRKKQIIDVIEKCDYHSLFSTITVIEPCYEHEVLNSLLFKRKIKKYFNEIGSFDTLILCNYKAIIIRYAYYCIWKRSPGTRTYIIDDGLSINEIVRRRKEEIETNHSSIEVGSRHLFLVFPYIRMRKCIAPSLVFFTNHIIKIIEERDRLINNEYVHLKEMVSHKTNSKNSDVKLCIIGQPLVQLGVLEEKTYHYWIMSFVDRYTEPNDVILYIPHPAEDSDNKIIKICKRIVVKSLDLPIEVFALGLNPQTIIVGFYSAALFNVHMMRFDLSVYSLYPFKPDSFQLERMRRVDEAYSTLSSSGIKIIREL